MATRSSRRERRGVCQFSTALSSAFTEWLLILLLFIDTFCLYLLAKIFRCSKLQNPCLVCSRFTYLLGNEKLRFYNDLVCDVHKLEMSTFAFCHVHQKLADAGEMCETCLLSFTKKKSSLETCKFLLSKLILDPDDNDQILNTRDEMVKVPLLENNQEVYSLQEKPCSCCSQPGNIKPSAYRLFEDKPIFKELARPGFCFSGSRLHSKAHKPDRLSKAREIPSAQLSSYLPGEDCGFDPHFLYRELKLSSDSESEVPSSGDYDGGNSKFPGAEDVREESVVQNLNSSAAPKDLSVVSDNVVLEKLIHLDPDTSDASSISKSRPHEGVPCFNSFADSNGGLGHGLEEINWINVELKPISPLSSQTTSELVPTEISNVESDTSRCIGLQSVTKRPDADISCLESADGSLNCEVEEDGSVDCLKRRIEKDRKFMSNLYKELEEERNASAIAANQAMAMINKLQEEKAAMQLEVMQYLRMMEEQTEYEQEALQKLNDQLTEREKEIKDLEAELESYRRRCWDESFAGKIVQPSYYDSDESEYSTTSTSHVLKPNGRDKHRPTGITFQDFAWSASGSINESVLDFEDEREYISECLKRLEKNVRLFSNAEASKHDEEDDEFNDNLCSLNAIEENCPAQLFNRKGERSSSVELLSAPVKNLSSEKWESAIKEDGKDNMLNSFNNNNHHPKSSTRNKVIALGHEIEHLHARLEALEADRDFLERTINSLRNGKDGLQFVQEIATHLREIRIIGSTQREQLLA